MADRTDEPLAGGDEPELDPLARRIRAGVDRAAPAISLGEVLALGEDPSSTVPPVVVAAGGSSDEPPTAPRRTGADRNRVPLLLAAAAVVVVLVGFVVVITRDRSPSVVAGSAGGSMRPPTAGGVFDPASDVLRDKRVASMAAGGDRLYLGYVDGMGGDPARALADPAPASGFHFGLLVVDAADGTVLADHALEGRPSAWAMTATTDRLWFATEGDPLVGDGAAPTSSPVGSDAAPSPLRSSIWSVSGLEPPRLVDGYEGSVSMAATGEALWVRSARRIDRRDVGSGDLIESSPAGTWTTDGDISADGDVVWSTDGEDVVPVIGTGRGDPIAIPKYDFGERRLFVTGEALLVVDGQTAARVAAGAVTDLHTVDAAAGLLGVDAGAGRFWLASLDDDPDTSLVNVLTIDGTSGEQRFAQVSFLGDRPLVAALPDGDAVICVQAVRTSETEVPTRAGFGSDCGRVARPTGDAVPGGPDGTDALTSLSSLKAQREEAERKANDQATSSGP